MSVTIKSLGEWLSKTLSRWSVEFSMLISVILTLLSLGLIDLWVVKTILTIALFLFFAGMSHNLVLAVYKKQIDFMNDVKKEETKESIETTQN